MGDPHDQWRFLARWEQGDYFRLGIVRRIRGRLFQSGSAEFVVVTQTCDLQPHKRPTHVTVGPLVSLDPTRGLSRMRRGDNPRYVHVPAAGESKFVDLTRIAAIPSQWLGDVELKKGLQDIDEQRRFAHSVGRWFSRYPFPDALHESLRPLLESIKKKHDKEESPEGQAFDLIRQVRVRASPSWEAPKYSISVILILDHLQLAPIGEGDQNIETWAAEQSDTTVLAKRLLGTDDPRARDPLWNRLAELWAEKCQPNEEVESVSAEVVDWREFGMDQQAISERLDLDYLSGPDQIGV